MFFPPHDYEAEHRLIPNSSFRVKDSLWVHFARFCFGPSDRELTALPEEQVAALDGQSDEPWSNRAVRPRMIRSRSQRLYFFTGHCPAFTGHYPAPMIMPLVNAVP